MFGFEDTTFYVYKYDGSIHCFEQRMFFISN